MPTNAIERNFGTVASHSEWEIVKTKKKTKVENYKQILLVSNLVIHS